MSPHEVNSSTNSDSDSVALFFFTNSLVPETTTILCNELWGDPCVDLLTNQNDILRLYCQNVNGIFDYDGMGLDDAFHTMWTLGANIFTLNKTHDNDTHPKSKMIISCSDHQILQQNNSFSSIQTSSSQATVKGFTKLGGNMVRILDNLVGRIRS